MRYKAPIFCLYYEPARELAVTDLVWRQRTPAVYWTSLTLHKRHNLAYIAQRRRCRGFGRCAGACWAMSVANRNRYVNTGRNPHFFGGMWMAPRIDGGSGLSMQSGSCPA